MTDPITPKADNKSIEDILRRFTKTNPDTAAIQDHQIADENIRVLTNHFCEAQKGQNVITKLLQIIMLLRYIHRHDPDADSYITDKIKLYTVLARSLFTFEDLFKATSSINQENIFYADISQTGGFPVCSDATWQDFLNNIHFNAKNPIAHVLINAEDPAELNFSRAKNYLIEKLSTLAPAAISV